MADARTWPLQVDMGGAAPWAAAALVLLVLAGAAAPAMAQAQRGVFFRDRVKYKPYTGLRADPDSSRQVYVHDQTIAVVELGPRRSLLNCELIEVLTPKLSAAALQNLSSINKPISISFKEMRQLMHECKDLEPPQGASNRTIDESPNPQKLDPWSIITGIVPGTKWCGNGDIASTYFDLGYFTEVDKCCREHDICPVKVRGFNTRYNIKNVSFYTKSHCDCDSTFFQCLKATQHPAATLMGRFYFNILRTQCIEDIQSSTSKKQNTQERIFRPPKHIY